MLSEEQHVAKTWVNKNYPLISGPERSRLIQAFGAGLDRGMAEAEEIMRAELPRIMTQLVTG
jgi:hypothetical protein